MSQTTCQRAKPLCRGCEGQIGGIDVPTSALNERDMQITRVGGLRGARQLGKETLRFDRFNGTTQSRNDFDSTVLVFNLEIPL